MPNGSGVVSRFVSERLQSARSTYTYDYALGMLLGTSTYPQLIISPFFDLRVTFFHESRLFETIESETIKSETITMNLTLA